MLKTTAPKFALFCLLGFLVLSLAGLPGCRRKAPHPQVPDDAIVLRGDVTQTTLRLADLQSLSPQTETWTHHGKSRQVVGVSLLSLLLKAGWSPGPSGKSIPPKEKHSGHRFVLIATAADGYQAVFSAGELAEQSTQALVVWSIDGVMLPSESGPMRLVVLSDHGMSRSLFQLRSIDVVDVGKQLTIKGVSGNDP